MRIPEFAEILIAQTGAWLRRGVYPAVRFLSPRLPLFEGWRPENDRMIASFLIRSLRWPLYCDHSVTSADVRLSVGPNLSRAACRDPLIPASPRRGPVAHQNANPRLLSVCPSFDPSVISILITFLRCQLLQLCVLSFGLIQDGNIRIGVLPQCEEIFITGLCLCFIL